ncbi:MAG TPA: hypothetical protein VFJ17_10755 [Mycobacteriales bacterium]|nr:hypothetical protein [Mycobacteriales bacterium]
MGRAWARKLVGLAAIAALATVPTAGAPAGAAPVADDVQVATSALSWAPPALIDHQVPFGGSGVYGGVSCPTTSFCAAVGYDSNGVGYIGTTTDPAGGAATWHVVAQIANGSLVYDVACPSTSLCVAIDAAGDVITSTAPGGDAAAWTTTRINDRGLEGIACPSSALCVAVDDQGNVLTSTNPTGGAGAWTKANIDGWYSMSAVSCASTSLCVATDLWGNVLRSTNPTGGAAAWSAVNIAGNHSLPAVACPSASLCVIADDSGDVITSTSPTGGADAWTTAYIGGSTSSYSADIACPTSSLCVLTDRDSHIFTSTQPTGGAAAWSGANLSLGHVSCASTSLCVGTSGPGNIATSSAPTGGAGAWVLSHLGSGSSALTGVSCVSPSQCVAVDDGGNVVTSANPSSGSWSFAHVDGSPLAPSAFTAVSCASSSMCVAVDDAGNVVSSTNPTGGAAAWTTTYVDTFRLLSISCPSVSLCVAGDANGDVWTSVTPTGGASSWTRAHVDNAPAGLNYLSGISCPSTTFCAAVDGAGGVLLSANPTGGTAAWTRNQASNAGLLAVSCPSSSLCVAAGYAGTLVTVTIAGIAATAIDGGAQLTAVTCPTSALCVATDAVGKVVTSTDPTGGAIAWTATAVDAGNALAAVSCPSGSLCVATDAVGNAIVGTLAQRLLTVTKAGSGSGTVTSTDGQINCGQTCSHLYDDGTVVTLNATPTTGSIFSGWSGGGCTGTGSCQVTMTAAKSISAPFGLAPPINVTRPVISGTARLGKTLTCSDGTWQRSPTSYTRRWYRNGAAISGATARTHVVVSADLQRKLTCAVTATNAGGSSPPAVSLAVVVRATTVLTERETTVSGVVRSCGASTSSPCRDRRYATVYFAGRATPLPIPAATRSVVVRFYHRSGGTWQLKATVTVRASSSTGKWRVAKSGVTRLTGAWRVRASVAGTTTLLSAVSGYRYYQVR